MTRVLALICAVALVCAACGGDDDGDGGTITPVGASAPDLDGTLSWSRMLVRAGDPASEATSPVRTDLLASTSEGVLVVSGSTAAFSQVVVALVDPSDGDVVWSQDVAVGLREDVVGVVDDVVVVISRESGTAADVVRAFDLMDGSEQWTLEVFGATATSVDGLLVVGSAGTTTALEPSTGVAVWNDPRREPLGVVGPGLLSVEVIEGARPVLALVDTATGDTRWTLDVGEEAVEELRAMLGALAQDSLVPPATLPLVASDGSVRALDPETGDLSAPLPLGLASPTTGVVELIAVGRPDQVVVCTGNEARVRLVGLELPADGAPRVLYDRTVLSFEVGATSFTPQIVDPGIRRLVLSGGTRRPCRPDAAEGFGGLLVLDTTTGETVDTAEGVDRVVLDTESVRPGLSRPVSTLVALRRTDPDTAEITWTLRDLQTGEDQWTVIDTVPTRTLSIVAGAVIVWEAETATVGGLDAESGEVSWVTPLTDVDPAATRTEAADSSQLYLGFGDRLVAID